MAEIGAGYKTFGRASRSMIGREKKTNMWENIISDIGSAGIFAAGQAKKSKTAWEDYETGYKASGGDVADIPKRGGFWKQAGQTLMPGGDKGFFQMPEGEVRIGDAMYDREKIQKAGSFLGTEASAVLDEGARAEYLKRVAPGKEVPLPSGAKRYTMNQSDNYYIMPDGKIYNLQGTQVADGPSPSYARGGDFITNGPQEILVGDNPGGRERVTVTPLPSKNDEERNAYNVWMRKYNQ
jgi:hypothetical protein